MNKQLRWWDLRNNIEVENKISEMELYLHKKGLKLLDVLKLQWWYVKGRKEAK